jgi:CO/xanthine dehydrogenase Mo-binding subunit
VTLASDPSFKRREDAPLLRGEGTFIDGLRRPELAGAVHAAFVRSTEAHAKILRFDTDEAANMPGVVGVFTGADLTDVWPLPPPAADEQTARPMMARIVCASSENPLPSCWPRRSPKPSTRQSSSWSTTNGSLP